MLIFAGGRDADAKVTKLIKFHMLCGLLIGMKCDPLLMYSFL